MFSEVIGLTFADAVQKIPDGDVRIGDDCFAPNLGAALATFPEYRSRVIADISFDEEEQCYTLTPMEEAV